MTVIQSERSPLARLMLFMVCLALAGSAVAGVHYYAVDIPMQNTVRTPENFDVQSWKCSDCETVCRMPGTLYPVCYRACLDTCY